MNAELRAAPFFSL